MENNLLRIVLDFTLNQIINLNFQNESKELLSYLYFKSIKKMNDF
jgi:hypothetical protein